MLISLSRTFRRFLSCTTVGVLLAGSIARGQPELMMPEDSIPELKAILEHAVTQSPRMIVRGFDEAASQGDLIANRAQRLPQLSASGDFLKAREDRADFIEPQSANKIYYRVAMSQPLFHWGVLSRNVENAKIRREIETGRTQQAFGSMVNEIRRKYLDLVIYRKAVERYRLSMDLLDRELEQAVEKRQLNTLSEAQLQDTQLKHKRGVASLAYYEDIYQLQKDQLARMAGFDEISDEQIADDLPKVGAEKNIPVLSSLFARYVAQAEPSNLDLQIALQDLEVKQNDLKNARMALRPKVSVIAGLTQDEQSYTANLAQRYEYKSLYAGLSVYWTIFDSFASRGSVKAALARLRAAEVNYDDTEARTIEDCESIIRQLKYRSIQVEVGDQELVNAENHYKYMQQQFERGEASENDLSQARLGRLDHWRETMNTRVGYWERMFQLLALINEDPAMELLPAKRL